MSSTPRNQHITDTQTGFLEFLDHLKNGDVEKAVKTKNKLIPKTLYKFVSLSDAPKCDKCGAEKQCRCTQCDVLEQCGFLKSNNDKIKSLEDNNLWLSSLDALNDPFELKSLYLDKSKLYYANHSPEMFDLIRSSMRVSCFIGVSPFLHMPMWAHYANNHKGFCVEYQVKKKYLLYPVHYVPKREPIHNIPDRIVSAFLSAIEHQTEPSEETQQLILWLFLSGNVKSDQWAYEGEYRILNMATKSDEQGELLPLQELGLKTRHIYLGKSCSKEHRHKLIVVSKIINCGVSDVYLDEETPEFILKYRIAN